MTEYWVLELLHKGTHLATSIEASDETKLAWVGVYSLNPSRESTALSLRQFGVEAPVDGSPIYVVRAFEVARTIIDADVWFGEDELNNKIHVLVIGDEALREVLGQAGTSLDQLERPYKSNYPI